MNIKITSQNVTIKIPDEIKEYHESFKKMCEWVCQFYDLRDITVSFMFYKEKKTGVGAVCSKQSRNKFIIYFNINGLFSPRFLDLFVHEFKHIQQYCTNKLDNAKGGVLWRNKFYPLSFTQDPKNYDGLPWEKEAERVEIKSYYLDQYMDSSLITKIRAVVPEGRVLVP